MHKLISWEGERNKIQWKAAAVWSVWLSSRTRMVPVSTLCWSPLLVSMHFHSSSVLNALETSWGCTGMKPWFVLMLSPPIPFLKGHCSQSLRRQIKGKEQAKKGKSKDAQRISEWWTPQSVPGVPQNYSSSLGRRTPHDHSAPWSRKEQCIWDGSGGDRLSAVLNWLSVILF